jgi:hypothetical protein
MEAVHLDMVLLACGREPLSRLRHLCFLLQLSFQSTRKMQKLTPPNWRG